jgi:hypothetical protein
MCTVTGHSLVDGVVHYFIYQVVETLLADVSNVHRRAFTDCLKALKDLNAVG